MFLSPEILLVSRSSGRSEKKLVHMQLKFSGWIKVGILSDLSSGRGLIKYKPKGQDFGLLQAFPLLVKGYLLKHSFKNPDMRLL